MTKLKIIITLDYPSEGITDPKYFFEEHFCTHNFIDYIQDISEEGKCFLCSCTTVEVLDNEK